MTNLLIISLAAYGFYHAIQALRNGRLEFKPFNCKICLSFWFSFFYVIFFDFSFTNLMITTFGVVGIVNLLCILEEKLLK